jgi:hypothetical protein
LEKFEKDIGTTSKAQQVLNVIWPLIGTRTARIVFLLGLVAIGMAFNWGWFVAAGIAPIILSILPCAVICGLGLCMRLGKKGSCSNNSE